MFSFLNNTDTWKTSNNTSKQFIFIYRTDQRRKLMIAGAHRKAKFNIISSTVWEDIHIISSIHCICSHNLHQMDSCSHTKQSSKWENVLQIICLCFNLLMATRSCACQRKVLLLTANLLRFLKRQKSHVFHFLQGSSLCWMQEYLQMKNIKSPCCYFIHVLVISDYFQ